MHLLPMGTLTVYIDSAWSFGNGPIGGRSCTSFSRVAWHCNEFHAESVWANGTYLHGPEIGDANIRSLFRTETGALFHLDYLSRVHLPTHSLPADDPAKTPAMLAGRIEAYQDGPHAWLNRTHLVGHGALDLAAGTQTYEVSALLTPTGYPQGNK